MFRQISSTDIQKISKSFLVEDPGFVQVMARVQLLVKTSTFFPLSAKYRAVMATIMDLPYPVFTSRIVLLEFMLNHRQISWCARGIFLKATQTAQTMITIRSIKKASDLFPLQSGISWSLVQFLACQFLAYFLISSSFSFYRSSIFLKTEETFSWQSVILTLLRSFLALISVMSCSKGLS